MPYQKDQIEIVLTWGKDKGTRGFVGKTQAEILIGMKRAVLAKDYTPPKKRGPKPKTEK